MWLLFCGDFCGNIGDYGAPRATVRRSASTIQYLINPGIRRNWQCERVGGVSHLSSAWPLQLEGLSSAARILLAQL